MKDLAALVFLAGVYAVALTVSVVELAVSALARLAFTYEDRPEPTRKGVHPCR